jgi:hypothetical protein
MWIYYQVSGRFCHDGQYLSTGYSGAGYLPSMGRNNPQMECTPFRGPIPRGKYKIGPYYTHPKAGQFTMGLTPVGEFCLCRDGLLIHGDNKFGDASEGCIILDKPTRMSIANSLDNDLEVL